MDHLRKQDSHPNRAWAALFARLVLGLIFFMAGAWKVFQLGPLNHARKARPSGQPEASFKLVKAENKEIVFENLQHDFPQRIIYRLQPDGSLFARIEGTSRGKARGSDYRMKRAQCN